MSKKIYDKNGKWVATETKSLLFENDVITDRNGKIINYLDKDSNGNTVMKDKNNRKVVARRGQDFLGNQIMTDSQGKKTAYVRKDSNGNTVFVDTSINGNRLGYYDLGGDGSGYFGLNNKNNNSKHAKGYYSDSYASSSNSNYYQNQGNINIYHSDAPKAIIPKRMDKYEGIIYAISIIIYIAAIAFSLFKHNDISYPALMLIMTVASVFAGYISERQFDTPETVGWGLFMLFALSAFFIFIIKNAHYELKGDLLYGLLNSVHPVAPFAFGPIVFMIVMVVSCKKTPSIRGYLNTSDTKYLKGKTKKKKTR